MKSFEDFGLSQDLNASLRQMNYTTPTPIQEKSIPLALDGHDILGSAQTGTGKTAAFAIPMVNALMSSHLGTAMVLTPTRELAKQVLDVVKQLLGPKSMIKTAFIIGGEAYAKQMSQLKMGPRIIIGTPGRINDHLERGTLNLSQCGFLVLDETDRMLDMGFGVQLDRIVKFLPQERQTLMFSATMPQEIIKLSAKYLQNPMRVSMGETNVVAKNIKQEVIRIEQDKKYTELLAQLHERQGSVIIFGKTKYGCEKLAKNLCKDGFEADSLHGDLRQHKRDKVMKGFRDMKFRILVATDIAARGLDVPHIEHVINYDLPQVAEDFIHRMGRTARAGATGSALSFVASQENNKWFAIEKLLGLAPSRPANNNGNGQNRKKSAQGDKKPWDRKKKQRFAEKRNDEFKSARPDAFKKREEDKSERNWNNEDAHAQTRSQQTSDRPRKRHFDEARPQGQRRFERDDRPQGQKSAFGRNRDEERRPNPHARFRRDADQTGNQNGQDRKEGQSFKKRFDRDGSAPSWNKGKSEGNRFERSDRNERSDRSERNERFERKDRSERPARPDREQRQGQGLSQGQGQGRNRNADRPAQSRFKDQDNRGPKRNNNDAQGQTRFKRGSDKKPQGFSKGKPQKRFG